MARASNISRQQHAHRPPLRRSTTRAHGTMPTPGLGLRAARGVLLAVALGIILWAVLILAIVMVVGALR